MCKLCNIRGCTPRTTKNTICARIFLALFVAPFPAMEWYFLTFGKVIPHGGQEYFLGDGTDLRTCEGFFAKVGHGKGRNNTICVP